MSRELKILSDEEHARRLAELKTEMGEKEYNLFANQFKAICQVGFRCHRCGNCCNICDPVLVTFEDIKRISNGLGMSTKNFVKRYTKRSPNGTRSLKNLKPCEFFDQDKKQCRIYDIRPHVCQYYPFMAGNEEFTVDEHCPGSIEVWKTIEKHGGKKYKTTEIMNSACSNNPELMKACQFLDGITLGALLGEIDRDQAFKLLCDYPNQKALNVAGMLKEAIFDEVRRDHEE